MEPPRGDGDRPVAHAQRGAPGQPPARWPLALPAAPIARRRRRRGLGRGAGPERLDDVGHLGPAPLHERPDAVRRSAADRPRAQPDGDLRTRVRGAGRLGEPACRAQRRRRRERPHRRAQRRGDRGRQGRAPRLRVRPDRSTPAGSEHPPAARREVVRRDVRGGPGRVVARRDHPVGVPVRDGGGPPRRHPGHGRSRRRPDDRHVRPRGHGRLPGRRAAAGLDARGHARPSRSHVACQGRRHRPDDAQRLDARGPAPHVQPRGGAAAGGRRAALGGRPPQDGTAARWPRDLAPRPARDRALVRGAAEPLPADRGPARPGRCRRRGDDRPGRVPPGRDPRARPARQRAARLHPRRQSPRLRPAHRPGRSRPSRCARTSCS